MTVEQFIAQERRRRVELGLTPNIEDPHALHVAARVLRDAAQRQRKANADQVVGSAPGQRSGRDQRPRGERHLQG